MSSDKKLQIIFKELDINIQKNFLETALTHSSKTFENNNIENYERLEYLGDSVLKLIMSEYLYKTFPEYNEGRMTKIRGILVSDATLTTLSKKINLNDLLILGNNEEQDGGREKDSVIACAFEAVIGAIYLSCGLEKVKLFLKRMYENLPQEIDKNLEYYNAKATLQEYTQKESKSLPQYVEISESGAPHDKSFTYNVFYNNNLLASGTGKSKKEAQQEAAKSACIKLGLLEGELHG